MKKRLAKIEYNLESMNSTVKPKAILRGENENNSHKFNLEFPGIPKLDDETRKKNQQYVQDIMKLIGSVNNVNAINMAHRKMSRAIIAWFKTRTQCDEVFDKRFSLKGITSLDLGFCLPGKGNTIFINESLTFEIDGWGTQKTEVF